MHKVHTADVEPGGSEMLAPDISVSGQPGNKSSQQGLEDESQCILIVEDDFALAHLEAGVLTAQGYSVVIVHNGELAVAKIRHTIPDLVLLDLELAGEIDGWGVLHTLRARSNIPVLLTTSSSVAIRRSLRLRGESRGTLDYLPKPYPMQVLLNRIKRMLMVTPE